MNFATVRIGKVIKTLGLMGIMMALAGLMVHAPSASAGGLGITPSGKLNVYIGFASNPDSQPQAEVAVIDGKGAYVSKGTTNRSGSYATAIAPGAYKVVVNAEGYKSATVAVKVTSGQATNVKVELMQNDPAPVPIMSATNDPVAGEESGKLAVNVSSMETGKPVAGATVILLDTKGNAVVKASTDSDGNFATAYDPGTYKLYIKAEGYGEQSQEIKIDSKMLTEVKVALSSTSTSVQPR